MSGLVGAYWLRHDSFVPESLPPISRLQVRDPEAIALAIRGAQLNPCQFDAHPGPSRLARIVGPRACLDFAALGPAMLFSGVMPADCFTLVFVRACPTIGRSFNFGVEHTDGYMGFFPPGALLDAMTPAGYGNAALTISSEHFLSALATAFPEIPAAILERGAGMRVGPEEFPHLSRLLDRCEAMVWQSGGSDMERVVRQNLEREVLEAFLAALRSGCNNLVPAVPPRMAKRLRHLRSAREFLAEHTRQPVYLDDLSNALGLSHRGVENLFQDLLGINPLTYLNRQRLHGVRRALLHAGPGPGTVKRIAYDWGFVHLGRFARDYRRLFGEGPSETLARPSSAR